VLRNSRPRSDGLGGDSADGVGGPRVPCRIQLIPHYSSQTVTVQPGDRDRYGRTVGEVLLLDGRSLNRELVRAGLAWMYRRYTNDQSLSDLEEEAQAARRGLWAGPNPIPPWEWRIARKNPRLYRQPRGPTAESAGTFDPRQYLGHGNRYNCPDFRSQAEAQAVLRAALSDPNRLDRDKDGIACERNPAPYDRAPVPRF